MTITRVDLIERIKEEINCTKFQAETILSTFFENITQSLAQGEGVELRGFGSFRIRQRGARVGRNPRTGEKVNVPPKQVAYFKPGKKLKEQLNPE